MKSKEYIDIKEKLLKLKVLSEKGVPNEKEVAKEKFDLLLKKYNITIDEIEDPDEKTYFFSYKNQDSMELLCQIIFSVKDGAEIYETKKKKLSVSLTKLESVEIRRKNRFYQKILKRQKELFLVGFYSRYNLYSKTMLESDCVLPEDESRQAINYRNSLPDVNYIRADKILKKHKS